MHRSIVFALSLGATTLAAQEAPLVGAWQLSFPSGMRVENGVQSLTMATGVLTLRTKGDSLVGELITDPPPGSSPRPPLQLAAKAGAGDAVFLSRSKAKVNIHGGEREITMLSTWRLRAKGDSLTGTVERELEGLDAGIQGANPVTGVRRKGKVG